jgi:hypothetical protein
MDGVRVSYAPHSDASSAAELDALANVYAYLIKASVSKKFAEPAQPHTGEEEFHAKEGGSDDLERNAIHGAESDRTEQTRTEKHGFVHR